MVAVSIIAAISSVIAVTGSGWYWYIRDIEYCGGEWITQNYQGIGKSLKDNLFGQHLAEQIIYRALKAHAIFQPEKPLALSFHGSLGTGKNYAARWIVDNWFKRGFDTKFVHHFTGSKDFPYESDLDNYTIVKVYES